MSLGIRTRMTLWYAVVLAVVLGIYTAGAYVFLVHRIYSEMDATLRSDFEAAEASASVDHDGEEPERWIERRDASGAVVARTGPSGILPETPEGIHTVSVEGEPVRVLSRRYDGAIIRVARSEAHVRQRLRDFLLVMGIALPLAVALLCAAGHFLAGRTLRPVGRIVERARSITAARLDERLPVDTPDDELGRLAAAFNDMFARLEDSFARMRRFTGDAAHELRTPLTALRSVGEVCLRSPDADARAAVASMLEEVERMSRLVDGMLRLARADAGEEVVSPRPLELGGFVRGFLQRFGDAVTLETGPGVTVRADPDLLEHAVGNIVDNAVRHGGGRAGVRVRAPGTIEITDEGQGIAAEHVERIFDRFYRVEESRARGSGGAGLGLAIAREAVEAQGGRVEVESEPGAGSTFRIVLPEADGGART